MTRLQMIFGAGLMLTGLAGCEPTPEPGPKPPPPSDECGASALQDLVGQDRSVLARMKFAAPVRVIGPNMAVTADYRPERLNIEYDAKGTITELACY